MLHGTSSNLLLQIRTEEMDRLAENGIAVESWSSADHGRWRAGACDDCTGGRENARLWAAESWSSADHGRWRAGACCCFHLGTGDAWFVSC